MIIYGYARSNINTVQLREKLRPYLTKTVKDDDVVDDFLSRCHYQAGSDYGDSRSWHDLDEKIVEFEDEIARTKGFAKVNRLFYFAIPPNVFAETGEAIKTSCMSSKGFSRMIVEKPFGKDLESCKEILARVRRYFIIQVPCRCALEVLQSIALILCSLASILTRRTCSESTIT